MLSWGGGGVLGVAWEVHGDCPGVKVFFTALRQGDASFKVKPANYVMA